MFVVDDPLLALILRFVVDTESAEVSNEAYLQGQLRVLRKHLARYPESEHRARAMEWVAEHAARYRRDWERNTVASRTQYLRCADCPLADVGASEHCEIHEQWLYLLHRYLSDEMSSRGYVEEALAVLTRYKDRHRHRLAVANVGLAMTKQAKKDKGRKKKKGKGGKKKKGRGRKKNDDEKV